MTEEQLKKIDEEFHPIWVKYSEETYYELRDAIIEWITPYLDKEKL